MDGIDIDEILTRLERGEKLMIDDQMRNYISLESGDTPRCFVVRSILAKHEDQCRDAEAPVAHDYEEQGRYRLLAEALLSLMDWKLQEKR